MKQHVRFIWGVLFVSILLLFSFSPVGRAQKNVLPTPSPAQEVIYLTNLERAKAGLAPLKENEHLNQSAQKYAETMATGDFFDHTDPVTGDTPATRISDAGYVWSMIAENIGAGYDSPVRAIQGWMASPGHKANILSPQAQEIGVGYTFDEADAFPQSNAPYYYYWVQNFGTNPDIFPLIINQEAFSTTVSHVGLYLYGQEWATEIRLRNDDSDFGNWQPFQSQLDWALPSSEGLHTVTVEMRNAAGEVRTSSDTIYLLTSVAAVTPSVTTATVSTPPSLPPPAGDEVMRLQKQITPTQVEVGNLITITLNLETNPFVCGEQTVNKPLDVALVIDHSGSMEDILSTLLGGRSKLENAKQAAAAFVDKMNMNVDRVALVQFDDTASLIQPLSNDASAVNTALQGLYGGGGTAIEAGMQVAYQELTTNGHPDATPVIIILSDGRGDLDAALQSANSARRAGIRVISVGIGNDVDQNLMRQIADTPDDYHYSPDTSDLQDIYVAIAGQIHEFVTATNIQVKHTFDAVRLAVLPDTISDAGELGGGTTQNVITWQLNELSSKSRTLSYQARVRQRGDGFIDVHDAVAYTLCEQESRAFTAPAGLWLQALEPTPTPTFTPAPTPTPILTPTPAGPILDRTPLATPVPDILKTLPGLSQPLFCSSQYWWLQALFLPLLLILLLLLFFWWWSRRNAVSWGNLWQEWRWACRILSFLLSLYLLFLAFLIGRELFVGSCDPVEAVYFWRMDSQQNEFGIFLSAQQENAKPVRFQPLSKQNCSGCHAVSNASHQIAAVIGPVPGKGVIYTLSGEPVAIPAIDAIYYAWSPDGQKLAFADSGGDISVLEIKTGIVTPLSGASQPGITETMPTWSPDGQVIAFVRSTAPLDIGGSAVQGPADIYTIPAEGGQPRPLPGASAEGLNYYPAYSPDGRWLAFTHHNTATQLSYAADAAEIYLVPAIGGDAHRISANDAADGSPLQNVSNSWPTWSRDGRWLAFNSKRNDPAFDIFVTRIDDNGNSGAAVPLPGASEPGIFEHTPFWGEPPLPLPLWQRLLNLWTWLLPLLLLLFLRWLLCRRKRNTVPTPLPPIGRPPALRHIHFLNRWRGIPPEWDPAPTLVIGLGGSGRHILTHLKKNLLDAGAGQWHDEVQLLLLDTSTTEVVQGQEVKVQVGNVVLDEEEQLAVGQDLRDLVRRMAADTAVEPEMQSWFPAEKYVRIRRLPDAQMDLRRTSYQRRPMGRASLFHDIQQVEESRIWQRIHQSLKRLGQKEHLRVILVGSLAGGFGSAVLADVAYLVRRIAGEQAAVLTAFLATDNVFVAHTRTPQLKLNSMAALREMSRFLLARGRPFPMPYRQTSLDKTFNGYIEWSLFDEVFLFDGQRAHKPLTLLEPEKGMFPLMADLMTVFIDRAGRLIEEVRANLRTQAATVQVEKGEPVVSTLGGYTYRLPLSDLVRGLRLRFAHDLLILYLEGPNFQGTEITLATDVTPDKYPDGLSAMVDDFLRGQLYQRGEGAGGASTLVADLAAGSTVSDEWRRLTSDTVQTHLPHFHKTLTAVVLRILNGAPDEEIITARCGKLGYAFAFVENLVRILQQARERADYLYGQLPEQMQRGGNSILTLIQEEEKIVQQMQKSLYAGRGLLLGEVVQQKNRREARSLGVLNILQERMAREEKWRDEIRQIRVRRTLADEKIFNSLYDNYFSTHLTKGLESLHWRKGADGLELALSFEGWQEVSFTGKEDGQETFLRALIDMAETIGQDVWQIRLDPFFDDEETGLWQVETRCRQEAKESCAWAEPTAAVRSGMARRQEPHRYVWANRTVLSGDKFARQVELTTNMRQSPQRLQATDPYSAAVITSLDILPLSALICMDRLETEYRNAYRIGQAGGSTTASSEPEPVHVFAAERNALRYEQRLSELYEPGRLFHPLFVAALEDMERARYFILAYALGWIIRERIQDRGEWRQRYVLKLPNEPNVVPLTGGDRGDDPVSLLVRAMQNFVLGHPNQDILQHRYNVAELAHSTAQSVESALEIPANLDPLRQFSSVCPKDLAKDLADDNCIGANDFWSFARLVVADELEGRTE